MDAEEIEQLSNKIRLQISAYEREFAEARSSFVPTLAFTHLQLDRDILNRHLANDEGLCSACYKFDGCLILEEWPCPDVRFVITALRIEL